MSKRKDRARPNVNLPAGASLDEIVEFIEHRKSQPIEKASRKLYDFVNSCVTDPDFLHPQSEALLDLLRIVRDHLCSSDEGPPINELWTLDDIMTPIIKKLAEKQAAGLLKHKEQEAAANKERNKLIFAKVEALTDKGIPGSADRAARIVADEESKRPGSDGMTAKTVKNICSEVRKSRKSRKDQ